MGFFDFFRTRDKPEQPPVTPPVSDVLLQALLNDEPITHEHAMTIPAVSGAVDFISGTIASMPIKLYKYKDGKVEPQEKDSRVKLLNGDTGDTLDAYQMKKAMVEDYLFGKGVGVELALRGTVVGREKNPIVFPYRSHSDFEIYGTEQTNVLYIIIEG